MANDLLEYFGLLAAVTVFLVICWLVVLWIQRLRRGGRVRCPVCGELIQPMAMKCRYCGQVIRGSGEPVAGAPLQPPVPPAPAAVPPTAPAAPVFQAPPTPPARPAAPPPQAVPVAAASSRAPAETPAPRPREEHEVPAPAFQPPAPAMPAVVERPPERPAGPQPVSARVQPVAQAAPPVEQPPASQQIPPGAGLDTRSTQTATGPGTVAPQTDAPELGAPASLAGAPQTAAPEPDAPVAIERSEVEMSIERMRHSPAEQHPPGFYEKVLAWLHDEDPRVREQAVRFLARHCQAHADAEHLIEMVARDTDGDVRVAAAESLGGVFRQSRNREVNEVLADIARNPEEDGGLRAAAYTAIRKVNGYK